VQEVATRVATLQEVEEAALLSLTLNIAKLAIVEFGEQ